MSTFDLLDLTDQFRAIGRASVFRASGAFVYDAGGTNVTMTHLGDTEGEITLEANEEYSELTLPELTGPAPHAKYVSGEAPVVTMPIYAADPTLRAILSPSGSAHGGYQRRRAVAESMIAIIPEQVFIESNAQAQLAYPDQVTGWTVGGNAATQQQLDLLDLSIWFWRGHFTKALPIYKHEDGGKVVQQVMFHAMHNSSMPDGHHLYTVGRPDQVPTTPIYLSADES
jgi:hypothetical protein